MALLMAVASLTPSLGTAPKLATLMTLARAAAVKPTTQTIAQAAKLGKNEIRLIRAPFRSRRRRDLRRGGRRNKVSRRGKKRGCLPRKSSFSSGEENVYNGDRERCQR